ncbi:hypothetical protein BDZ91DRAFT_382171 [Kalaharituber pfeilii]|nr:hypothetical protein BDZ91DRAFT_382171 [Kalaharituber pfeilii]
MLFFWTESGIPPSIFGGARTNESSWRVFFGHGLYPCKLGDGSLLGPERDHSRYVRRRQASLTFLYSRQGGLEPPAEESEFGLFIGLPAGPAQERYIRLGGWRGGARLIFENESREPLSIRWVWRPGCFWRHRQSLAAGLLFYLSHCHRRSMASVVGIR